MSDSVRPHKWQPTRLPRPWDSPGKNTGVGCHFLLQCMKVKSESEVPQSSPTLCDPMDRSLLGSSIHGIFQARVLEWGAIAFSDAKGLGFSNPYFLCCAQSFQLCLTLCHSTDCSPPGSSAHGFSRQEYWSGLPCPPSGDLPNPGTEPVSPLSPELASGFFTTCTTWEAPIPTSSNMHHACF